MPTRCTEPTKEIVEIHLKRIYTDYMYTTLTAMAVKTCAQPSKRTTPGLGGQWTMLTAPFTASLRNTPHVNGAGCDQPTLPASSQRCPSNDQIPFFPRTGSKTPTRCVVANNEVSDFKQQVARMECTKDGCRSEKKKKEGEPAPTRQGFEHWHACGRVGLCK